MIRVNFLSQINFYIARIASKHNQVVDELVQRSRVNAISIASQNYVPKMIDEYAIDLDFKDVMSAIALRKVEKFFQVKYGYLLYNTGLCVTHNMHNKGMYKSHAPP